jgi:hypothetical protein
MYFLVGRHSEGHKHIRRNPFIISSLLYQKVFLSIPTRAGVSGLFKFVHAIVVQLFGGLIFLLKVYRNMHPLSRSTWLKNSFHV